MILVFILIIIIFWVAWTAICLISNYARARKLGVPIVILPISTMNILWIVLQPAIVAIIERLFGSSNFTRFASRDWHFREKARPHLEFGAAWALVTPGEIWFNVADPEAIIDIFQRRTQFIRPIELYQMLNVFGHNAATVGWAEWRRQRKIISAPFNERANQLVWVESIRQTQDLIKYWIGQGAKGQLGLQKDTRTLALNVLAATTFGRTYKFHGSNMARGQDEIGGYREALSILMDNSLFMMLVPMRILRSRFVPHSWARIGLAVQSFKEYMLDLLDQERATIKQGKPGASHLTSSLLRASEEYSPSDTKQGLSTSGSPLLKGLTVNELLGNIFLINYAGHDTTANTLAYAIILLAMNPQVQEWLSEEVRAVLGERPYQDWEYGSMFHRLKRPLAVMYETVRLFPPIMALPKYTSGEAQQLTVGGSIINVPSKVYVVPSLLAMHTHPEHWGPDALEWKPSRWIGEDDEFFIPERGTYLPWSEGPQNCPGKKFAQVEFVAVIACLFESLRVRPVCGPGESLGDAMKRLRMVLEETSHGVLLRMKNADGVRLSWTRTE